MGGGEGVVEVGVLRVEVWGGGGVGEGGSGWEGDASDASIIMISSG